MPFQLPRKGSKWKKARDRAWQGMVVPPQPGELPVPRAPKGKPAVDRDELAAISARQMARHRGEE